MQNRGEGVATSTGRGGQQEQPFVVLVQDHIIVGAKELLLGRIERDDFYFGVVGTNRGADSSRAKVRRFGMTM